MTRPLIPFVQNGYYASRNWIPLVKGNGFTTSGGGEQEEVWETASGSIVTFDAVPAPLRQLSVAVEPVQNLNGYDNPWPAGGGKNKFDASLFNTNTSGAIVYTTYDVPNGTYTMSSPDFPLVLGITNVFFKEGTVTGGVTSASDGVATSKSRTITVTDGHYTVAYRSTNADNTNNPKNFKWQIESGSTATSYAPYSNICPISGWTQAKVYRTGVNVWDEEWENGYLGNSGVLISDSSSVCSKNYIPIKQNESFYGKCPDGKSLRICAYKENKTFISLQNVTNYAFTLPAETAYIKFSIYGYGTTYANDVSINYPSTDQEYHAYTGNTYTIQLGETVYGGTLDVVNGKMTVDRAMVACTWGDFLYKSTLGSYVRGNYDLTNRAVYPATAKAPQISNVAPHWANFTSDTLHFYCNGLQAIFFLPVGTPDSTAIQISYELATPFELTLTPEQISTLQGVNNVWSDAGNVTVEYRAQ